MGVIAMTSSCFSSSVSCISPILNIFTCCTVSSCCSWDSTAIFLAFQDQVLIPRSSWEKKPAAEPKPQVEQQSLVDMILQRKAEMPAEEESKLEKPAAMERPVAAEKTCHTPVSELPKMGGSPSVDQLLKRKQPERSVVREEAVSYTAETPVVPADFAVDGIAEEMAS